MSTKVKVKNIKKNVVTINLSQLNQRVIPLNPNGFAYLSEDELAFLLNTSHAFQEGLLVVDGENPFEIEIPISNNAFTDEMIITLLKKPVKTIEVELGNITSIDVIENILVIAKKQDKGIKLIELIEERINALRGE